MKTIPRETLRAALRAKYGRYRITRHLSFKGWSRSDHVHVYGLMPDDRTVGWWLMGDILTAELWLGLHEELT